MSNNLTPIDVAIMLFTFLEDFVNFKYQGNDSWFKFEIELYDTAEILKFETIKRILTKIKNDTNIYIQIEEDNRDVVINIC